MAGKSITLKALRAREGAQVPPRLGLRILAVFTLIQLLLLAALLLLYPSAAGAAPVSGEVAVSTRDGYVRLVFTLSEETDAEVRLNNGILVIAFKQPVDVKVGRIAEAASSYVGAARRDPDGAAVRLALTRKVTVNTMAAGEKLFVDLLPEGWTGLPPSLPQEVVEELARRAREAEKKARQQLATKQQRALPPVRVRVGMQPTFTRYTFALPELINVSTKRGDDQIAFTFEAPIKLDLADVQAVLPPTVAGIEAQSGHENITLRFEFIGKVDVRTFREDNNYVIDVVPLGARGEAEANKPDAPAPVVAETEKAQPSPQKPAGAEALRTGQSRKRQYRETCHVIPEPGRACSERGAHAASRTRRAARHNPGAGDTADEARAAGRSGSAGRRRGAPPGRVGAADLSVRRSDPGRRVPPRRYDLAGVRQPGADRHQQDRGAVRPDDPQRRGHALAAGPGHPAQARQAEACEHRCRGTRLDRRRRRHDARADAAVQCAARRAGRAGAPAPPFRSISRGNCIVLPTRTSATRCWS